jgi:hypothetical protein
MNAVDTGWVTDEDPAELAKETGTEDFQPFRYCDGAARVMDLCLMVLITGKHWCGKF